MRAHRKPRLHVQRLIDPSAADTLASDVLRGLTATPKTLPPKHLYDDEGGRLFEEICELPEYYPTRTEAWLLAEHARDIARQAEPVHLIELGSGSARKTRMLLEAMGEVSGDATYWPVDVNESQLEETARTLQDTYPWLAVNGLVADFEHPLVGTPRGPGVLLAILGGTIGNFDREESRGLLTRLAQSLGTGAWALVGTDMVKDPWRLAAAYDDSRGVTAAFNLNVLKVINRKLDGDFDLAQFEHVAFYDQVTQQIEMHLRSRRAQVVHLRALGLEVAFRAGETLRTEISRKFTPESGREMFSGAGFEVVRRFAPPSGDFSLWLLRVGERAERGLKPLAPSPAYQ